MISETNCPIAVDPAPPAVTERTPAEVTVPARSPADPAAYDVTLEKLGASPKDTAAVGTASACVYD